VKVALLGTGLMGSAMAQKLLEGNVPVVAYNRTPSKLDPLRQAGAEIATSPQAAIAQADCIILMLTDAAAIDSVLLSQESRSALSGRTVIQMGTIAPAESRSIGDKVVKAGGDYLEAPVLGSIPQVKSGELIVMVGSAPEQLDRWSQLLQHFGPDPVRLGDVGAAAAVKLALNQLIASLSAAFSLSLGMIRQQGADVEQFMQILRQSALYAPTFDKKLSRMLEGNFANPNFPTKHLLKDTDLFLEEARSLGQDPASLEGVRQIVQKAIAQNLADEDYSSLFQAINGNG
jgi:3-hydroxyisobutyrate dehydrogenase